ncbi:MAG: GGDEF domain-containing protein, partial [Candidatus Deferrimicrobiaceae bacterium]
MQQRFLWGGVLMILVGVALALLSSVDYPDASFFDSGRSLGFPWGFGPLAVSASFALLIGVLLLLLRAYLSSSEDAVRMLGDAVRLHGGSLPDTADTRATAVAALRRLDRYRVDMGAAVGQAREEMEGRIREITEAHKDLHSHHLFTKKMLQSHQSHEVFETLLTGVRDGFGFPWAVLGILDEKGDIVFGNMGSEVGGSVIRIPSWDEGSIMARSVWRGHAAILPSLDGQKTCREDRAILGEGPAFLVPLARKPSRKCSDVKACGHLECPAYKLEDTKCWIAGFASCRFNQSEDLEEKRKECVRCEMFAASAILVVRSHPAGRRVCRETTESIITLVKEAAIALELVEMNEKTRKMSITDGLTGVANHREFYQSLGRELARARRYGHSVSLLMVDVDDFKKFNDRFGHLAGDFALKKTADLLRGCVRANDVVARYGGEEFGVILPEATPAGALMLAERIKTEIYQHNFLEPSGEEGHLTVSIGIYSTNKGDATEEKMVKFADEATYLAKNMGKNRVVVKE